MTIKAILFDSGRVLNQPRTGHWFMPPKFFSYVDKNSFEQLETSSLQRAFQYSLTRLHEQKYVRTEEEEYALFVQFYSDVAEQMPALQLSQQSIEGLAQDVVYNYDKFLFPDDVFEVVPRLSAAYSLGVVSDTWPSLERVFHQVGLREYFSTFIMSSMLGVSKPHERMYTTALEALNVQPHEAIFIDDNLVNLEGAKALGLQTVWMLRDHEQTVEGAYTSMRDLRELEAMLKEIEQ
ncbi:HAD family hydrolase [Paenibacillus aquistagni]|uniref:HAD family hydrolase n=1 Tax=Paenibacillus aquistagni TaxID=1852522 RepID=UPI00145B9178|nr:HAD-IA family hydrolase [Paenibacillus aquistagni]NMM53938.1 HAD-IA family hydrolase [Paenibacillus aquistagni]